MGTNSGFVVALGMTRTTYSATAKEPDRQKLTARLRWLERNMSDLCNVPVEATHLGMVRRISRATGGTPSQVALVMKRMVPVLSWKAKPKPDELPL